MVILILVLLLIFAPAVLVYGGVLAGGVAATIFGSLVFGAIVVGIFYIASSLISKRKLAKLKPIYDEQLKELGPEARFFVEVQPLRGKTYSGVEEKLKILAEMADIAIKCGIDLDKVKADMEGSDNLFRNSDPCGICYNRGFSEIQKAQDKYMLKQENGNKIMFYLCMTSRHGSQGLENAMNDISYWKNFVSYAEQYSIADLPKYPRDVDKLTVIKAYNEGAKAYGAWRKSNRIIPYFHEWVCINPLDWACLFV